MKTPNKIFKLFLTATLLAHVFIPNFVLAEEVTDTSADPTPTESVPVESTPTPVTEPIEPELTTTETTPIEVTEPKTEVVENSAVVEATETVKTETVEEKTEVTEPTISQLVALPDPSSQLTIRIGNTIVATDYYSPGTEPVTVTDNTGATHTINPNSVLAMLVTIDARNDNFAITDLGYYSGFDSFIINCITVNGAASCYNWQYTLNDAYLPVGADDAMVTKNSQVYLYFGEQNRFTVEDDTVSLNQPVVVRAEKYDYRNNLWAYRPGVTVGATVANPADPWNPIVTTSSIANEYGEAQLYLTATGTVQIGIAEDYYYPTVPVTARLAETNITLNIQTTDGEFFKQNVKVTSCPNTLNSPIYTLNAWCAVEQTAAANNWTMNGNWFGSDVFLDKINDYSSDFANNKFWSWYHDLNAGQTGLNSYLLNENEEILLTYGVNPLKLTVSESFPMVHEKVTVTISEQDFSDWNIFPAPWKTLGSTSTLYINGEAHELSNGTYELEIATDEPYVLSATKTGYAPSNSVRVTGEFGSSEETTNSTDSSGGTTPTIPSSATFDVTRAAEYLFSQQKSSGAIGSASFYTDWAAIALGSLGNSDAKSNLVTYLKTDPAAGSSATDFERRAMALLALGINPYSDTKTNYIGKILGTYDGTQFGDSGLVNDDVFALFPLLKAGYTASDSEIQKSVAFILSKQNSVGGWESPDLTAAAIQALSQVKSISGVDEALVKAKNYLRLSTKLDGRIGDNSFSTSWGLQALSALGESTANWNGSNTSPIQYLANQQQADGGVDPVTTSIDNRVWSTSYALPAIQGRTWSSLLSSASKPSVIVPVLPIGLDTSTSTLTIPTSTINFVTTTPEVPTTTPEIVPIVPEIVLPVTITPVSLPTTVPETAPIQTNPVRPIVRPATETKPPETVGPETQVAPTGEQLIAPTETTPESETKHLLQGAAAVAGTAGAYLAWRFIQALA